MRVLPLFVAAVILGATAVSAQTPPPPPSGTVPHPPPAQRGVHADSFDCGDANLAVTEIFDRSVRPAERRVQVRLDDQPLPAADLARLDQALVAFGAVQATSLTCLNRRPYELSLIRYTPDAATLRVFLNGMAIREIR